MLDAAPDGTLTIEPAARYLSTSVMSVRRLAKDGVIPCAKYLGKLHFYIADLDEYVAEHTHKVA
jgi:excisionase family DNA binding protein